MNLLPIWITSSHKVGLSYFAAIQVNKSPDCVRHIVGKDEFSTSI